ncbi:hypothetical protein [Streptomyces sp. ISL-11]|uniref:hypothetical protein n=1 Tax=Streptomyces sp. ISL-11 TaxID=2819174 RepID=UPI001BE8834B|nr:hypothetical protein [Streptomyces sp. ISL-11]MBT2384566.1 hypothetical protein [Streptomyces sp. ISL-11]
MLRHVIAPTRFFSQIPNEIIRHPRLSAEAVRLLIWQLSQPNSADVPLSRTADQAGIKKTAFMRAKRELMAEGYFHEWRRQGPDGRWSRPQLVSNVPLTADEAVAVRAGGIRPVPEPPTAPEPAVGEPSRRAVGRSQDNRGENNTSHPPHPLAERGAQALVAVCHTERRLRLSGPDIKRLAPLVGEWLLRGATLRDLRDALTDGLPERVHSPAGITRDRLLRKMPDPALPAAEPAPRPQPLRACAGGCGRMMRPVADESECRDCRQGAAESSYDGAVAATRRGMGAVRAAMRNCVP